MHYSIGLPGFVLVIDPLLPLATFSANTVLVERVPSTTANAAAVFKSLFER